MPKSTANEVADRVSQGGEASCEAVAENAGAGAAKLFATVPHDFALASRTVFYGMAGVMAVAFVVALVAMPARQSGRGDRRAGRKRAPAGR